jgi:large repetitive protein
MLLRVFSRRNKSSSADRRAGLRTLRLERLEDRQLLSAGSGLGGSSWSGAKPQTPAACQASYAVPAAVDTVNLGPTISMVLTSAKAKVITWNAADSAGVAHSSLAIDGVAVANVYGPYAASAGVNYAGVYGALPSGSHTYVVTATDNVGNSSQYTGTLVVGTSNAAAPAISRVGISTAARVITWNAADATGVAHSSLAIDGVAMTNLCGPYTAPPGVNYAGVYGALLSGTHTYAITATNGLGNSSVYTGTFSVTGPTISMVSASTAKGLITWNAADPIGVTGSSLTVDGVAVTNLCGPFTAPPGLNYAGAYGSLSSGNHTYVIKATDSAGNSSQYTGTFAQGPTISGVMASETTGLITWNALALSGVASSSLTIDGAAATVYGPYGASSGVNYAGECGTPSPGTHTYVITATDTAGNVSQYTGTFAPGPTIGDVAVSTKQGVMSWNATAAAGVMSSGLTVDGIIIKDVYGPYVAANGVNFVWAYGVLASGTHTYTITAVDKAGNSSQHAGAFTLPG